MRNKLLMLAAGIVAAAGVGLAVNAATEDVAYPQGYAQRMALYTTVDRTDNGQVRLLYAPREAIEAVRANRPLPSGTVLVAELYRAQRGADNQLSRGADGRLVRGDMISVLVMEKRGGWGMNYPAEIRNTDWEYANFTPQGQRAENRDMTACVTCHAPRRPDDFVFSMPALRQAR
jgi:Cytochrome P460